MVDLYTEFSNFDCSGNLTSYTIPSLFGEYAQFCSYFSISGKLTVIPFSPFSVQWSKYAECAVQSIISHFYQNQQCPNAFFCFIRQNGPTHCISQQRHTGHRNYRPEE